MVEAEQVLPIGQISKWRLLRDLLSIPDSRMSKTPGSLRLGLWEVHFLGLRALRYEKATASVSGKESQVSFLQHQPIPPFWAGPSLLGLRAWFL